MAFGKTVVYRMRHFNIFSNIHFTSGFNKMKTKEQAFAIAWIILIVLVLIITKIINLW